MTLSILKELASCQIGHSSDKTKIDHDITLSYCDSYLRCQVNFPPQQRLNSLPLNCYYVTMIMVIMKSIINEELQLQI